MRPARRVSGQGILLFLRSSENTSALNTQRFPSQLPIQHRENSGLTQVHSPASGGRGAVANRYKSISATRSQASPQKRTGHSEKTRSLRARMLVESIALPLRIRTASKKQLDGRWQICEAGT